MRVRRGAGARCQRIPCDRHYGISQGTLEKNGVHLPENMYLEFQKPNADRPRIVVYEQKPNSKYKVRVFYLQLVMMAGK